MAKRVSECGVAPSIHRELQRWSVVGVGVAVAVEVMVLVVGPQKRQREMVAPVPATDRCTKHQRLQPAIARCCTWLSLRHVAVCCAGLICLLVPTTIPICYCPTYFLFFVFSPPVWLQHAAACFKVKNVTRVQNNCQVESIIVKSFFFAVSRVICFLR